jgi:hypothetical protein
MALPTGYTVQSTPNVYDFAAVIAPGSAFTLCRAIYVGTGGTSMTVTMGNGDTITISNPASGDIVPIRCTNVTVAGLVANLVALY